MPTRTLITALALCWLAGLAHAQAARFAGSWYCRYAMEPFSGQQPFKMPAIMSDPNTMYFQFRGNTHMTNITCSR